LGSTPTPRKALIMTTATLPRTRSLRPLTATGRTVRAGGEKRGSNRDRAARKVWLLWEYGNGEYAACVHCGAVLTYDTIEADRIVPGGTYARHNVQPADRACNLARSNDADWTLTR
jgi:hypothetical protein